MDGSIRLDLGCGNKKQEGWLGVDIRQTKSVAHPDAEWSVDPDIIADITKPLPMPDDYADEIRAIHVIEHFDVWTVPDIVKEWVRVLKPGGKLAIECPDLHKVAKLMDVPEIPPNMTLWALYGDPRHKSPEMMHKWCYRTTDLFKLMAAAGLVNLIKQPAQFHHPVRDQRVVGFKPIPESVIVKPE